MIIKRLWNTVDEREKYTFVYKGQMYKCRERQWEGWFLFGIIPLYIKNDVNAYYNHKS